MKVSIAVFLVAAAAGFGFGRAQRNPVPAVRSEAPREIRNRVADDTPVRSRDEWIEQAREWQEQTRDPGFRHGGGFSDLLADWSTGEIEAALDFAAADPDCVLGAHSFAVDTLFGELMGRDLDLAMQWFDETPGNTMRGRMALGLSARWPAAEAERGLDFLLSHRDLFPDGTGWSILVKNMEATSARGPMALGELLERFADERLGLDFGNPAELPADFDFETFVTTEGFRIQKDTPAVATMLSNWMTSDREAAFAWCVENGDVPRLVRMLPADFAKHPEYLEWLGGKTSSLDEEQVAELFDAVSIRLNLAPRSAAALARGIEDGALREKVLEISARAVLWGDVEFSLSQLEGIDDPTKRVGILADMVPTPADLTSFGRRPASAEDIDLLKRKLADWGADETQIETITGRLKR